MRRAGLVAALTAACVLAVLVPATRGSAAGGGPIDPAVVWSPVDADGSGLYEALDATVTLNLTTKGDYVLRANLATAFKGDLRRRGSRQRRGLS